MTTTLKVFFTILFSAMALTGLAAAFELVPAGYGALSAGGFCTYAWLDIKEMFE